MKHWAQQIVGRVLAELSRAESDLIARLAARGLIVTDLLEGGGRAPPIDSKELNGKTIISERRLYRNTGGGALLLGRIFVLIRPTVASTEDKVGLMGNSIDILVYEPTDPVPATREEHMDLAGVGRPNE